MLLDRLEELYLAVDVVELVFTLSVRVRKTIDEAGEL